MDIANSSVSRVNNSFIEKLKPSSKNKIIAKKFKQLSNESSSNNDDMNLNDLRNWGIEPIRASNDGNNHSISQSITDQWNNVVKQACQEKDKEKEKESAHATFEVCGSIVEKEPEFSVISENMEYINNFIEENYQMVLSEFSFLKSEYHLIIPFLLIRNKEIHRMSLSDYEIKYAFKQFKSKNKNKRIDAMDYYKKGLIFFYQGKFLLSYSNFKNAYNMRKEGNIVKWLAFTCLIIIFCYCNNTNKFYSEIKIDFSKLKDVVIAEDKDDRDSVDEGSFFGCCTNRKKKITINISSLGQSTDDELSQMILENNVQVNRISLCKELEELLPVLINEDIDTGENNAAGKKDNYIGGWWMYMIISTYAILRPDQKAFDKGKMYDPKLCVKKVKEKDDYLGYVIYAEYSFLMNKNFDMKSLLEELVKKFPTRIEAYLRYWHLLVKGKDKDFKLALQLSEAFWKNSALFNFDSNSYIYYMYILITYAKSLYYVGNHLYTITYFQKEFPSNFLYPSIYYLFGKYAAKSKSKVLKSISISVLKEAHKVLYEDLQFSSVYWLGFAFFNSGSYDNCYKLWKHYIENSEKCFDITAKKAERIRNFLKEFEVLGNSLTQLKQNLNYVRSENFKNRNDAKNNSSSLSEEDLKDFLSDLQAIKSLSPNIKHNYTLTYEFYRGMIHFYVGKNFSLSLSIFLNIVHNCPIFMDAYYEIWRILKLQGDYRLLTNFSYFMIRNGHNSEVTYDEWVKCYLYYSKALFLSGKTEDASAVLRNILDIYVNIPLEEVKFLSEINKANRIFTTNNVVNFDQALSFYSKYHVYKKCESIFNSNYKTSTGAERSLKKLSEEDEVRNSLLENKNGLRKKLTMSVRESIPLVTAFRRRGTNQYNESNNQDTGYCNDQSECPYLQTNQENFDQQDNFMKEVLQMKNFKLGKQQNEDIVMENISVDSIEKLEEYIERNLEIVQISEDLTYITIISNPIILYQIGKFAAKSQEKPEMGILCLEDYVHILKFQYNYNINEIRMVKKYKALFYMGVLYCFNKTYKKAKETFDKIKLTYFEDKPKKLGFIIAFTDFFKRVSNNNSREEFDFYKYSNLI